MGYEFTWNPCNVYMLNQYNCFTVSDDVSRTERLVDFTRFMHHISAYNAQYQRKKYIFPTGDIITYYRCRSPMVTDLVRQKTMQDDICHRF